MAQTRFDFRGSKVLIVGATSGIGRAAVEAFVAAGADVGAQRAVDLGVVDEPVGRVGGGGGPPVGLGLEVERQGLEHLGLDRQEADAAAQREAQGNKA